jgi:hypothetical protein
MNTSVLKTFAPAVRRHLLEAVTRKLDFALSAQTPDYLTTYARQVASLRSLADADRAGLIERVAYTWFNRLAALRYLDAKGWHPFRARVLTPASSEETQPELLKLTRVGSLPEELRRHTSPGRLDDLLDGLIPSPDPPGEVYRHLVLAACHFYHALLPDVFERLDDETELLLPDDLLTQHSVAQPFRTEIADDDCAEVEIIGWLYQFYISERKDEVMARKTAVPKGDIPAVTQLFTPHWIVRYLIENSLGRLWLLNRPDSRLREKMPYYIESEPEADFLRISRPEDIRVLDPAAGSGHMLTYAFDLLYAIYEEEGYAASDIPALVLRHNLHGLDICPRAAQLAELALLFKAREKSRRFFQPEYLVRPNIMELREVRFAENELRDYIHALDLGDLFNERVLRLMYQFDETKNFGSLIQPYLDEQTIAFLRGSIEAKELSSQLFLHETHRKVLRVLDQAEALAKRYHIVVANPPYMGGRGMNAVLAEFARRSYPRSKSDLFSMFIQRGSELTIGSGYFAMVTMQSWMFLSSYEELRSSILKECTIESMMHLDNLVMGIAFGTAATIWRNRFAESRKGAFGFIPYEALGNNGSPRSFPNGEIFRVSASEFRKMPGGVIAYWVSNRVRDCFLNNPSLDSIAKPRQGATTSDNNRFLRLWSEVSLSSIYFQANSLSDAETSGGKWFPYNKGGLFRKWVGNQDYVINYQNDGAEIKAFHEDLNKTNPGGRLKNQEYYFRECVSWSKVSSGQFAIRYFQPGFIFDVAGSAIFFSSYEECLYFAGFLNSIVVFGFLKAVSPTINYEAEHLACLPVIENSAETPQRRATVEVVAEAVAIARSDWDNFETSWNFCDLPLLRPCIKAATLEASWRRLEAQCQTAITRLKDLETENNRLFIEAYGLQDELSPEVPVERITLARADTRRDVAAFLSYAVGCMMGRYSLDRPGLILANAGDSLSVYSEKVGKPMDQLTFVPDEDGIIPVLDGEWFEEDIVAGTREFLRATFGDATLRDNVRFIEDSLGKDLRKYFVTDFYKDHLQTYKKRPIYWMVQSPRKSFSVLIYLHRYTRDTLNLVLNRYLREFEVKVRNRIERLAQIQIDTNTSTRDKAAARKEGDKLLKALHDCEEWERQTVLPLAQARLELDLDDGVKTNYLKLCEVLAPIPGLASDQE